MGIELRNQGRDTNASASSRLSNPKFSKLLRGCNLFCLFRVGKLSLIADRLLARMGAITRPNHTTPRVVHKPRAVKATKLASC